jgi:hypothetical protein
MYIAAVFEDEEFGKFEYDNSFESGKSFVIKIFLVFSSGNMKDLSASITFCRTIALTNLVI